MRVNIERDKIAPKIEISNLNKFREAIEMFNKNLVNEKITKYGLEKSFEDTIHYDLNLKNKVVENVMQINKVSNITSNVYKNIHKDKLLKHLRKNREKHFIATE